MKKLIKDFAADYCFVDEHRFHDGKCRHDVLQSRTRKRGFHNRRMRIRA